MPDFLLTIAIPTYNRAGHLEQRLQELIPQIKKYDNVALCVFDDGSTDHTAEIMRKYREHINVMESAAVNSGLGRNMLRAFETTSKGWLWTLGDDDPVLPDGVATALELIHQHTDSLAINCHSEGGYNLRDYDVSTLSDFLQEKDIADILFMSSNLYNMEVLRPYLKAFCHALGTLAPHLVLLLSALEDSGRKLSLSTRQITSINKDNIRWSSLEAAWGIANIPVYIKHWEHQRLVAQSARRVTRWMLRYGLREVENPGTFARWKRYTRLVDHILADHGAGIMTDLLPNRQFESFFSRISPVILSCLPYFMIKTKARTMRETYAGQKVVYGNN